MEGRIPLRSGEYTEGRERKGRRGIQNICS